MLRDYKYFIENILSRRFRYIFAVGIKHRAGKNRAGSEWTPPIAEVDATKVNRKFRVRSIPAYFLRNIKDLIMKGSAKIKTKLRKAEVRVLAIESAIIVLLLVITVFGMLQVLNGSLIAVIYAPAAALVASLIGEDASRVINEAHRRDGNG